MLHKDDSNAWRKRSRSPPSEEMTVDRFAAIIASMQIPATNAESFRGMWTEVVDVFRKSQSYRSAPVVMLRRSMGSLAVSIDSGCSVSAGNLAFVCKDLVTAMSAECTSTTFDEVWNAAKNVFASNMHFTPTRFVQCSDFLFSELTTPFKDGTIVPHPLDLVLQDRCTNVHVCHGESGIGKTATLMMGAHSSCSPTYKRTLGVYLKATKFPERKVAVGEATLAEKDNMEERDAVVREYLVGLVNEAMINFLTKKKFSFDMGIFNARALVLCVDELGSRTQFVRAVINDHVNITQDIINRWGFWDGCDNACWHWR